MTKEELAKEALELLQGKEMVLLDGGVNSENGTLIDVIFGCKSVNPPPTNNSCNTNCPCPGNDDPVVTP